MFNSRGLRLSFAGAILVAISTLSLFVLPGAIGGAGMLVGGMAVMGGFVWTMAEHYSGPGDE